MNYINTNLNMALPIQIIQSRERGILRGKPLGCPLKVKFMVILTQKSAH